MTQFEKVTYMRIATSICGFNFTEKHLDLFVSLYDLISEKQEKTDLKSIMTIECEVEERDKKKKEKIESKEIIKD